MADAKTSATRPCRPMRYLWNFQAGKSFGRSRAAPIKKDAHPGRAPRFLGDGKTRAKVFAAGLFDVGCFARLLSAKIVRRNRDDHQAAGVEGVPEAVQTGVLCCAVQKQRRCGAEAVSEDIATIGRQSRSQTEEKANLHTGRCGRDHLVVTQRAERITRVRGLQPNAAER